VEPDVRGKGGHYLPAVRAPRKDSAMLMPFEPYLDWRAEEMPSQHRTRPVPVDAYRRGNELKVELDLPGADPGASHFVADPVPIGAEQYFHSRDVAPPQLIGPSNCVVNDVTFCQEHPSRAKMHQPHPHKYPLPLGHRREPIVWGYPSPAVRRPCVVHDWYFDGQLRFERCLRCDQRKCV
jgi:hypothetical protein